MYMISADTQTNVQTNRLTNKRGKRKAILGPAGYPAGKKEKVSDWDLNLGTHSRQENLTNMVSTLHWGL